MVYRGMDDVRRVLEPYHGKLRDSVAEAWKEWRQVRAFRVEAGMSPPLYHRTVANYIFDAVARKAIPTFGKEPRVRVQIEAQTFKLHFRGVSLRIKKGGEDGLGSNVTTQAVLAFINADATLPGLPPETAKVEVIWEPNDIWTQLERVLVVARDGDHLLWQYEIEADAAGEVIPIRPLPRKPGDAASLIKPKSKPTEKPKKQ
jgi:hypothetical protein